MDTSGSARQAQLQSMKLRAIVADHLGVLDGASLVAAPSFGLGAGLIVGDEAWVLLAERAAGGLGPALAWARQSGFPDRVGTLHVLAEESTGVLARRAARFSPPVTVWQVDGRSIVPAEPAPVEPVRTLDERHESLRALIVAGGAIPVEEHGVLVGEVHGLEVCRVTDGPDGRDGRHGWRSASAPTTGNCSRWSTATSPRSTRSPGSSPPWPGIARREPSPIRSTASAPNGPCARR